MSKAHFLTSPFFSMLNTNRLYPTKKWKSSILYKECFIRPKIYTFSQPCRQLASKRNKAKALDSFLHDHALPPPPESFPPYMEKDFFKFEIFHQSTKPGSKARAKEAKN